MAVNKRKHPRVRARGVAANLRAQEVLKTGCVVENISAGGLLVRTDQSLEAGTPVVMDLVRPGMKKLLKLSGRVVGRVDKAAAQSPATVPGLRVQFDPMPDETVDRLQQLLRELGLQPENPAAAAAPPVEPSPLLASPPAAAPGPAPAPPPARNTPPPGFPKSPTVPLGPTFGPADLQQITWAPQEGMEETRAMSMAAVQSALDAAELTPPGGKVPVQPPSESAKAARAPPPIMPVPSGAPGPAAPKAEGEGGESRLMVQIRGLLMELGDVQNKLDVKERESDNRETEVERLRRENRELREKLERAQEQLRLRDVEDPDDRF